MTLRFSWKSKSGKIARAALTEDRKKTSSISYKATETKTVAQTHWHEKQYLKRCPKTWSMSRVMAY